MKIKILSGLLLAPLIAQAEVEFKTFNAGDMTPLGLNYGAPRSTSPAYLESGQWQWQLGANIANTLHLEQKPKYTEILEVDSEILRYDLHLEYGLSDAWDLRLEVPFIDLDAGSLDGFIDDFHQALGFPEGSRPGRPEDLLRIRYVRNGQTLLDTRQPKSGVGDASVSFVRSLETGYEDSLSYGVKLKFPTGSALSTDTHDLALWATAANQLSHNINHFVSLGGVGIEKNKGVLADLRRSSYGFLRYGFNWRLSPLVELKIQLDTQSSLYKKTDTRLLGHSSSAALGGTLHMQNNWGLDIAIIEDIDTNTTSDVVLHFNLRKHYGG